MPDAAKPLLTIAVPTYGRARQLDLLLRYLAPQLENLSAIELLICDNASPDSTEEVVHEWIGKGLQCRYERSPVNLGPDNNFLRCYTMARGSYVWIFGDDDVIFEGALAQILAALQQPEIDLLFIPSLGFKRDPKERTTPRPRTGFRVFRSPEAFLGAVGFVGDLALISSVILNKESTESFVHADYEDGRDSNLIQLGWTFTALRHMRRAALFEQGLISTCEVAPSRPFDVVRIFSAHWKQQAERFLDPHSRLYRKALDGQMYAWFPANWVGMRRDGFAANTPRPAQQVYADYRNHWQFWVFTWPLLLLPLPLARTWLLPIRILRRIHAGLLFRHHAPVKS